MHGKAHKNTNLGRIFEHKISPRRIYLNLRLSVFICGFGLPERVIEEESCGEMSVGIIFCESSADLYKPSNQNRSAKFITENTVYYCSKKDLNE